MFLWLENLLLLVPKIYMNLSALEYIRRCSLNTCQIIFSVLNMARGGFFYYMEHFFVPWTLFCSGVLFNRDWTCSLEQSEQTFELFCSTSPAFFVKKILITERPKISFLSLVSVRINLLPFKHIEFAPKRSHECFLVKTPYGLKLSCLLSSFFR